MREGGVIIIFEASRGRGENIMGTETERQEDEFFGPSPPRKF